VFLRALAQHEADPPRDSLNGTPDAGCDDVRFPVRVSATWSVAGFPNT
jgi:hypothetical protein